MHTHVVVPSRGDDQDSLMKLVEASGLDVESFVLVRTAPTGLPIPGAVCVDDFGDINIQRWWNAGLREAQQRGSQYVAFLNDDVSLSNRTIPDLVQACRETGATVSTPGLKRNLYTSSYPLLWKLDGAMWVMNARHGLSLDEGFRWWMGDRDMEMQARRYGRGVATVQTHYAHQAGDATLSSFELQQLLIADKARFAQKYPLVARAETARAKWPAYRDWARMRVGLGTSRSEHGDSPAVI